MNKVTGHVTVPVAKLKWAQQMVGSLNRPRIGSVMTVTFEDGHLRFAFKDGIWGVPAKGQWPALPVYISAAHFRRIPDVFLGSEEIDVKLDEGKFWVGSWGTELIRRSR